jgi:hypothetical protein
VLPQCGTLFDLEYAILDSADYGECVLTYFCPVDESTRPIAGLYYDRGADESRPDVPMPSGVSIRDALGAAAGSSLWFFYGMDYEWRHTVRILETTRLDEEFPRRLLAGERAFPPFNCLSPDEYLACVEYATTGRRPEGYPPRIGELKRWHPERFDLSREKRSFDRGAFITITKEELERRSALTRAKDEFLCLLRGRAVDAFGKALIETVLARGSRSPWRTLVACPSCAGAGHVPTSVEGWIDAETSTAAWRCPRCASGGTISDEGGEPVRLPDVEDLIAGGDVVDIFVGRDEFMELARCEMPFGEAEGLLRAAELTERGIRIVGSAERMGTLQMFVEDHLADWACGNNVVTREREQRLERVADLLEAALSQVAP